jgi:hypothetical protein
MLPDFFALRRDASTHRSVDEGRVADLVQGC